jgi:hypothetical protein
VLVHADQTNCLMTKVIATLVKFLKKFVVMLANVKLDTKELMVFVQLIVQQAN